MTEQVADIVKRIQQDIPGCAVHIRVGGLFLVSITESRVGLLCQSESFTQNYEEAISTLRKRVKRTAEYIGKKRKK